MKTRFTAAAVALLIAAGPAAAWNKAGHMVSGAIAYTHLKTIDPPALTTVVRLLKAHPQFADNWSRKLDDAPDGDRDLVLFMLAARWADDIRDDSAYHHSKWHYINLPIKPEGQPPTIRPPPPDSDNILRAFEVNLAIASSKSTPDVQRAVALCWLFHLVGDAHQPLHAVSLFTTDYPRGDRGGNSFHIRVKPENTSSISLHKFWDDLIIGSENYRTVRNKATELRHRPQFSLATMTEMKDKNFENWLKRESFQLAKDVVYRQGRLAGSPDATKAPVLPEDYIPEAKAVGERRIVVAGYRLAEVLSRAIQ